MKIEITEKQYLKWDDYWELIKIMHKTGKNRGENRLWIASGLYGLWCLYWILVLKNSWYILIPVLILDSVYISIYIFGILRLYKHQKIVNKFIEKHKKILLSFEEKELSVLLCGTSDTYTYTYEKIVCTELKNVFFINVPVLIPKDCLKGECVSGTIFDSLQF